MTYRVRIPGVPLWAVAFIYICLCTAKDP